MFHMNLMFSEEVLNRMKKGSILINIKKSRSSQRASVRHLQERTHRCFSKGTMYRFATYRLRNVILTPHTAPYTDENLLQ